MISDDPNLLPDDVNALKAMIAAAYAEKALVEQQRLALEAEIATHEAVIAEMKAAKAADAEKIGRWNRSSPCSSGPSSGRVRKSSGSIRSMMSRWPSCSMQAGIYVRDGVELDRSLMAQWMGRVGFELEPLAQFVLHTIKQGERIFADETRLPTLAPGSGKVKTAWLWAYARDDRPFGRSGPPMVAYRFEDTRSGECVARHLEGFRGIQQVDGYTGYAKLGTNRGANDGVTIAGCWAHARRKFFDLQTSDGSPLATAVLNAMTPLWAIEDDIRGNDAQLRLQIRQERSRPIVAELFAHLDRELARISGKSKLAEAIRYATGSRAALERFHADSRIEIDSNIVEPAIRPRPIRPRMHCSPVPTAVAGHGPPSPRYSPQPR